MLKNKIKIKISPKISYGVLECDIVVTELHAYDFVIKKRVSFVPDTAFIFYWGKMYLTKPTILSVQFSNIKYFHIVVQPSAHSSSELFRLPFHLCTL